MLGAEYAANCRFDICSTSGTTAISQLNLGDENTLIAIESVAMIDGELFLSAAPKRMLNQRAEPKSYVKASLERSLKENADVWVELSKY
jgi:hypothetical protein